MTNIAILGFGVVGSGCAEVLTKNKELAKQVALLSQTNHPPEITVEDLVAYGRYPHQRYGHGLTRQDEEIVERAMAQNFAKHALAWRSPSTPTARRAFLESALSARASISPTMASFGNPTR